MNVFAPTQQALSDMGHSFGNRPIRELNRMRVDEERTRLAGIEAQRQEDTELKEVLSSVSDEQKNVTRFNFYKERNPEKATEIATEVMKQGNQLMKLDPEGAVDYINSNLGTDYEYEGKKEKLIKIKLKGTGKVFLVDPVSGEKVKEYDVGTEKPKPQSSLGKLKRDLENGIITEEEFNEKRKSGEEYAPTDLKKTIDEYNALLATGADPKGMEVQAYVNKLTGSDVEIAELTDDEVEVLATIFNGTGKMPSLGRGKEATALRVRIAQAAAKLALESDIPGVEPDPEMTPVEAAFNVISTQSDTKAIQGSLNFLTKQLDTMGSFIVNMGSQINQVGELAKDLETYDTRLLNVPLRTLRAKIIGSPLQAKYDMYLTEIEQEMGKLATSSTQSVAELSIGAQERWDKIHDKALSTADMLSLLKETKHAATLRLDSVSGQLDKARKRMKTREYGKIEEETFDTLPEGAVLSGTVGGKNLYTLPDGTAFLEQ